jgi:hypothetical protein
MRTLISILLLAALSGCAMFTSPKEQPVIEDHVQNWFGVEKVGVLSTTAERREVIFKFPGNKFCAEPPPDVAESLTSSLRVLAEGTAKDKTNIDATARIEVAKTLATAVQSLFRRSQGSQLFRDGSFNLCQAYLNGTINEGEYVKLYEELLKTSKDLVIAELPYMQAVKAESGTTTVHAPAGQPQQVADHTSGTTRQVRAPAQVTPTKQPADSAEGGTRKSPPPK